MATAVLVIAMSACNEKKSKDSIIDSWIMPIEGQPGKMQSIKLDQAQFDELSSSITNHTVFGQGRIIKAFPEMKHRDYFELIQELKKKLR